MRNFKVPVTLPTLQRGVSVTSVIICSVAFTFFLSGCKESNADKVSDAQSCLDTYARAGGGDLTACEAHVAGINSPAANGIRCAAGFIREGFSSAQSFVDAFAAIETVNNDSVRDFLRLITFDAAGAGNSADVTTNYTNADQVFRYCASSLAKGATIISSFSLITNILFKYSCDVVLAVGLPTPYDGNCNMNDAALAAGIAYGIFDSPGSAGTVAMKESLGTVVVKTNSVSCSTGASNDTLCEFLSTAITEAGGPENKATVGEKFLRVLANPP